MKKLIVGLAAATAALVVAAPTAHAADPGILTVDSDPSDGSVGAGTAVGGQPLVGARYANGALCVGFSYQVPLCVELASG